MAILIKRLLALFLLPAGIVLLLAPYNTFSKKFVEQDFVYLSAALPSGNQLTEVTYDLLRRYPDILKIMEDRDKWFDHVGPTPDSTTLMVIKSMQGRWEMEPTDISMADWQNFVNDLFGAYSDNISFEFQRVVYNGSVRYDSAFTNIEVTGLNMGRRIAGGVFLVIGLFILTTLYVVKKGIPIARPGVLVLWDVITILFAGIFIHAGIEVVFIKLFSIEPIWDQFFHFMGIVFPLTAIPILTLFISATGAQSVTINDEGISSDGLFRKKHIPWSEVINIETSDFYSVKAAGDAIMPKHLTQVLNIEGKNGSITIMEPPLKSTKGKIINELLLNAPETLKDIIHTATDAW